MRREVVSGHCSGDLERVEKCNEEACPVCVDCIKVCRWGEWEHWESCTKCGGQRKRTRQMHSHEKHWHHHRRLEDFPTEALCDPGASEEVGKCPRKCGDMFVCEWTSWQKVGGCSSSCGAGTQKKVRTLQARKMSDLELAHYQNQALVQDIGLTTSPETTVFLSFVCGMFCFALLASIWNRCSKSSQYSAPQQQTPRELHLLE
jgi:hypothetical protein